jgi:predicted transcriptional regulator
MKRINAEQDVRDALGPEWRTVKEVMASTGLCTSTVWEALKRMEARGEAQRRAAPWGVYRRTEWRLRE